MWVQMWVHHISQVGKMPQSRARQPTPVFLPGEFHGQRGQMGYGPQGCKELDTTEVAQARQRRAPAERLLWPGRASPSASQLLAFSPGKEQAAGEWETCLAPGWPQLRSRLPFGPRSQASLQNAQGRGCANCQSLPQAELFVRQRERPGLPSQAVAWPPRLSAGRRESGSQRPWLGEAAPQPEGSLT